MRPALLTLAALLCLLPVVGGRQVVVYRLYTKADLVDAASVHASRFAKSRQPYLRYVDLAAVPPAERPEKMQVLAFVINSLSLNDDPVLVHEVPGTEGALAYVDVSRMRERHDVRGLKKLLTALDRLGELGSGAAPFPEPFYHAVAVVETEDVREPYTVTVKKTDQYGREFKQWDGYAWQPVYETVTRYRMVKGKKTKKVALGPWLNKATAVGLSLLTRTEWPVFEFHWFVTNAMTEPRYHELLGTDDTEASFQKLFSLDEKTADRRGSQVRGCVLFSEVAHHNRILERTPTTLCYGKGTYQSSYDFKTSVNLQDVLKDLLLDEADAKEIIANLPNGLLAFAVFDGKGKRLDKADGDVANNRRGRFRDSQVRTAFHCLQCHLPDRGWLEVDDEVRALMAKPVKLLADAVSKDDERRGDRIRQKFLRVDFNSLLQTDQAVVEAAVEAATRLGNPRGLTCPRTAKLLIDVIFDYLEAPVTLQRLALELGAPQEEVLAAIQTEGVDPVLVMLRSGRKCRRDQIEAGGFVQAATLLYLRKSKAD